MKIKTRIAPSPTGSLHIGTARTALFSWIFAKQNQGSFVLRIEDTDLERSDKKFEKDILDGLSWLGLKWDEGPYRQSERLPIYKKYLEKLLEEKKVFFCSHAAEELAKERDEQMKNKEPLRHICSQREGNESEGIIRLKNDCKDPIVFKDMIRGEISFDAGLLGDFALAKNLETPLYNFAVVVDDSDMEISHVIRGEDHIPNTPKQILIGRALGFGEPHYSHLPLILGKDRSKLSKRHGAVSVNEYKKEGYLPEAIFNFMALLGWHPQDDREIFSPEDLIKEFTFERIQKGGAVFDLEKLNWMNGEYMKKMSAEQAATLLVDFLPDEWKEVARSDEKFWTGVASLEKDRIVKLSDIAGIVGYFFHEPEYDKELLRWKGETDYQNIVRHLNQVLKIISEIKDDKFDKNVIEDAIMPYANEEGRGDVLWPMRVALCGKKKSPGPFEIAAVLGKPKTISRIKKALELVV